MLFSVILPVYNTNIGMLERCLKSVYEQTFQDYELIIIDDGSNEKTADAIDRFVQKFVHARVIHKVNEGVSVARNIGISMANGEYIMFVDADDTVQPYALQHAAKAIQDTQADVVYGYVAALEQEYDSQIVQNWQTYHVQLLSLQERRALLLHMICAVNDGKPFQYSHRSSGYGCVSVFRGPMAKVVKTSLARKCQFIAGLPLGEDGIWNIQLLKKLNTAAIDKSVWYNYHKNPESATNKFRPKGISDDRFQVECMKKELQELPFYYDNDVQFRYRAFCRGTVVEMMHTFFLHPDAPHNPCWAFGKFFLVTHQVPWRGCWPFQDAYKCGKKEIIKWMLYQVGLFLPILWLKRLLICQKD